MKINSEQAERAHEILCQIVACWNNGSDVPLEVKIEARKWLAQIKHDIGDDEVYYPIG